MGTNWQNEIKTHLKIADTAQKLIYAIAVCSLLSFVIEIFFPINEWIALSSNFNESLPKFWTFVTYTFFHAGIFHLLFNLIALFYFSQLFTTYFTQRQLLAVFLFGSIFAGLFFAVIIALFDNHNSVLLGASGGIMAILFATVRYEPNMAVRLPLIGVVKLWHIAVGFLLIDLLTKLSDNFGGMLAHFGGALFGLIFTSSLLKGTDLSKWIFWNRKKNPRKQATSGSSQAFTERYSKADNQKKVNEILDKIRKSGYDSLSKKEKEFLFKQK